MNTELIETEKQALSIDTKAQGLNIKSQSSYDEANEFLKTIKTLQSKIKFVFEPMKAKSYSAWKEVCANENRLLELPIKAEQLVKSKMLEFWQSEETKRRELEYALQARAEAKRQEALAKAEELRGAGKEARAEKYEEKASQIIAPTIGQTFDRGSVSVKKLYHAEVFDLMALVKAVAKEEVPITLIQPNMLTLNAQARTLREEMKYPGVKVVVEDNLSTRR